ncbi:unnamed protein product [Amoebophrya sp. A120]|nr:unnamed protein product [Amoebophrya sp. A120]|eukprot:GSA120T00001293001.1
MSGQKPAANRSTLLQFKARIVGAKKGYGLLKKKRDALKTRFQAMLHEIIECKKAVGAMVLDCAFSYAKAEYASDSEFSQAVLNRVKKPSITITMKAENCAGVQLPRFTMLHDAAKDASTDSLGIGCGGQVIQSCRDQHRIALQLLIQMASLQTMFKTLDEEIKMTSRRVNSLECYLRLLFAAELFSLSCEMATCKDGVFSKKRMTSYNEILFNFRCVVIPRLEETMQWVKGEMDEMEREEFFRVKKVVEKKKQRHAKELAAMMAAQGGAAPVAKPAPQRTSTMGSIAMPQLGMMNPPSFIPQKDKDILF